MIPIESHPAGSLEQVRPNLSLLEGGDEDALGPPAEELHQVGLAQVQRQPAQSSPLYARQSKATSWSCLQEYRELKSEIPSRPSTTDADRAELRHIWRACVLETHNTAPAEYLGWAALVTY